MRLDNSPQFQPTPMVVRHTKNGQKLVVSLKRQPAASRLSTVPASIIGLFPNLLISEPVKNEGMYMPSIWPWITRTECQSSKPSFFIVIGIICISVIIVSCNIAAVVAARTKVDPDTMLHSVLSSATSLGLVPASCCSGATASLGFVPASSVLSGV